MPSAAASGTHWPAGEPPLTASAAKAGVASSIAANDINTYCSFFMNNSCLRGYAASGWLMLTVLAPSRYAALLRTARGGPNAAKLKFDRFDFKRLTPQHPFASR